MNHKSLHILVLVMLILALASPASQAALAATSYFTPSDHQAAARLLGQPSFTSMAAGTSRTGMNNPFSVSVDHRTGKVFVADEGNNRVLRFASVFALYHGAAAQAVLGQANFSDNQPNRGGGVAANTLYNPSSIAVDAAGRLWVADSYNHRVLYFNNAFAKASGANADGVLGQPNFTSSGYATSQNGMRYPTGVFVDLNGRLWVADHANNRVLRFDAAAAKANGANADGLLGQADYTSHDSATTRNGMYTPFDLFVDSAGRLWVAEDWNNRVLRFDNAALKADGADADGVLGQPDFTSNGSACSQSGMYGPYHVSVDPAGRLFVSEIRNNRVLVFDQAAGLNNGANAALVLGQANFITCTSNAGGISARSLSAPAGVFFDSVANVLWLADAGNNRVLMYGNPTLYGKLVLGQPGFTTSAWSASQSGMGGPHAIAIDPITAKVFVSDFFQNRVLRFASLSALSNGAAAEAVLGQADFTHVQPNSGAGTAANTLYYPNGIAVDASGRLWVVDSYNNRVLRFDHASFKSNGADADGVLGQAGFTASNPAASQHGMDNPTGVFVDSDGRLWVADFANNRVLRFDNAVAKANGANADGVLGQANFTSNDAATTQNGMITPFGLFMDSADHLWVADYGNYRVLRFDNADSKSDGANADGVLGQADFTSKTLDCSQSGMNLPGGVSGDPDGRLYVADSFNNRVLVFDQAAGLNNGADASIALGQPDFSTCSANTGGISAVTLSTPFGIFFDPAASVLWVADNNNDRVLMYGTPQFQVFVPVIQK